MNAWNASDGVQAFFVHSVKVKRKRKKEDGEELAWSITFIGIVKMVRIAI